MASQAWDEAHPVTAKPTVADLGIDVDAQTWVSSGGPGGAIEIAFVGSDVAGSDVAGSDVAGTGFAGADFAGADFAGAGEWVLMRVAGDPAERVLVYDRFEWDCFLDGAKNGEFDDAVELVANLR